MDCVLTAGGLRGAWTGDYWGQVCQEKGWSSVVQRGGAAGPQGDAILGYITGTSFEGVGGRGRWGEVTTGTGTQWRGSWPQGARRGQVRVLAGGFPGSTPRWSCGLRADAEFLSSSGFLPSFTCHFVGLRPALSPQPEAVPGGSLLFPRAFRECLPSPIPRALDVGCGAPTPSVLGLDRTGSRF